mmetsp:Transcript_10183/g.21997  ORF Transcript_10183/g.21997 Transcript_10183/m.21997 type:complete len:467 (+) Transcript_10183:258-1658(+)
MESSLPQYHKVVRLAHRPTGKIDPPSRFLPVSTEPIPTIQNYSKSTAQHETETKVLVHRLYLSLDPAMRGWMSSAKSYLPPVPIGEVMRGATIGEVVAIYHDESPRSDFNETTDTSKKGKLKIGDIVSDFSNVGGWQEYALVPERSVRKVETLARLAGNSTVRGGSLPPSVELPLPIHLSILGTTGLTAYFGLIDVCSPKPPYQSGPGNHHPETILVTAAAGAVGSIVCQVAKFVYGCKVVGVAGGPRKCSWLKDELKCCDVVIDYRDMESAVEGNVTGKIETDASMIYVQKAQQYQKLLRQALKQVGSKGFDMMFDNVGGYQLNETLYRLNPHSRVALCGAISGYNVDMTSLSQQQSPNIISPTALYMKHGMAMISLRAKIQGFIVLDYIKQWGRAKQQLAQWIVEGKIQYQKEDIREGLENAPAALLDLFNGENKGKLIVKIGDRITTSEDGNQNEPRIIASRL